jgi:hypothetical protein
MLLKVSVCAVGPMRSPPRRCARRTPSGEAAVPVQAHRFLAGVIAAASAPSKRVGTSTYNFLRQTIAAACVCFLESTAPCGYGRPSTGGSFQDVPGFPCVIWFCMASDAVTHTLESEGRFDEKVGLRSSQTIQSDTNTRVQGHVLDDTCKARGSRWGGSFRAQHGSIRWHGLLAEMPCRVRMSHVATVHHGA